jgi:hypothetical protein
MRSFIATPKVVESSYLPGYNAVESVETHLLDQRTVLPPSSLPKNKPADGKPSFHAGIFLIILFDPEDGDDMFPQNVS